MDFGWDWSLAAAPQGIYGEVKILVGQSIVLENPLVVQDISPSLAKVKVYGQVRVIGTYGDKFDLKAEFDGKVLTK